MNLFRKEKIIILIIFILALAVRLIYIIPLDPQILSPDSSSWNQIAFDLLGGEGYGDAWRPPLYSFFLSAVYYIFGYNNVWAVRLFQAILSALTCVVVYFIGKKVFDQKSGFLAGLITSFYPYLIYFAGDILSETLFTFLIACSLFFLLRIIDTFTAGRQILAGLSLGLAALCKSTVLAFLPFVLIWMFFALKERRIKILKSAILILLFAFLTISAWTIRNYIYYKHFVLISTGGASLWLANNPQAIKLETLPEMNIDRLPSDFTWYPVNTFHSILKLPRIEADKKFTSEALSFIKNNPKVFRKLCFKRFLHYWRLYPVVATYRNKIIALATSGILLPLGWLGMLCSIRYWRKTLLLIFLLFAFTVVHMIFIATIRYRVPIDPHVIIFAAYTLTLMGKKMLTYRKRVIQALQKE